MKIPDSEFKQRLSKVQEEVNKEGLDALLIHSNESDFANVRYLSDYWPLFETAGVLVPKEGDAILIIGPESETFARDRSKIQKIRKVLEYLLGLVNNIFPLNIRRFFTETENNLFSHTEASSKTFKRFSIAVSKS